MVFIKNIFLFLKNVFEKEHIKMIEGPKKRPCSRESNFINELRENVITREKEKVKIPMRYGDGLGIQDKIKY